jgi:hypothetical protein
VYTRYLLEAILVDSNMALWVYAHGPRPSVEHGSVRNELYRARYKIKCLLKEKSDLKAELVSSKDVETHLSEEVTDLRIVNRHLENTLHSVQGKASNWWREVKVLRQQNVSLKHCLNVCKNTFKTEGAMSREREQQLLQEIHDLKTENGRLKQKAETHIPFNVPASKESAEVVSGGYECADPPLEDSGNYSGHDVADDNSNMPPTVKESLGCSEGLNSTNNAESEISSLGGKGDDQVVSVQAMLDTGPSIESSTSKLVTGSSTSKLFTGLEKPVDNMSNIKLFPTLLGDDVTIGYHCPSDMVVITIKKIAYCIPCQVYQVFWMELKAREENIHKLEEEKSALTRYVSSLEESTDEVGTYLQQICEHFCPRWSEIEAILRPLNPSIRDSEHWHNLFAEVLGIQYVCKRSVMEMFKEWSKGKCSYPAQWKTLLDRFQKSGCPDLVCIANYLRVRLHETIPQERLLHFETEEKGNLCIACDRPLPTICEHLDKFNINIVESQEETPLPNPTEAQV